MKSISLTLVLTLTIVLTGCSSKPRPRLGSYATPDVSFHDASNLGNHNFNSSLGEAKGMVYTCSGGDIDIAHLRIAADHAYYLYNLTRDGLAKGKTQYTFNLTIDPTRMRSTIEFPANFNSLSSEMQQQLIDQASLELAQYYTWYLTTWHEIGTWYGRATFVPGSEFHSAFAWEDSYSNLLGAILGARAIEGAGTAPTKSEYNKAMTTVLEAELTRLGAIPAKQARAASESMRGKWFTGRVSVAVKMLMRNLDVGTNDNCISPALIPNACPTATPFCLAVPNLAKTRAAGFKVTLEVLPDSLERSKIMPIIYGKGNKGPIYAETHLPIIAHRIADEAREKGYSVIE
ncbi:MAG: hypothetical protein A2Y07_03475 [Planctomycetes bacterium GWF2_50_10]|nr:MAG: hypothetical protein A2Y07_03475 [Planctomycetes bacterium GWF2_50_10]